jgi:UDP-N-acetylglucosamine--N-acetylmuramyl-(pentapeptide) pyrophosphoryl-undecaprenol N-acetylglucosamine transferase
VPFPYAADDHQTANALALEHAGGAICVKQTQADVPRLVEELSSLLGDRARRIEMSRGSRSLGKPDAATDIARDLCELAEIPWSLSPLTPSKVNGSAAPTVGA